MTGYRNRIIFQSMYATGITEGPIVNDTLNCITRVYTTQEHEALFCKFK